MDNNRNVISAACNCPYTANERKCKHVAAVISYVNQERSLSKTNHEQEWGKPSRKEQLKEKYAKGNIFENMFKRKNKKSFKKYESIPLTIEELEDSCPLKSLLM